MRATVSALRVYLWTRDEQIVIYNLALTLFGTTVPVSKLLRGGRALFVCIAKRVKRCAHPFRALLCYNIRPTRTAKELVVIYHDVTRLGNMATS